MSQTSELQKFSDLHEPGNPLVLVNAWDAGSAKAASDAGAQAIASGSMAVAGALGYPDGEECPFEEGIFVLRRMCDSVNVPVTHDIERGYSDTAAGVAENVAKAVAAGAVGVNIEDSLKSGGLRPVDDQVTRLSEARKAADTYLPGVFINSRTDVFAGVDAPTRQDVERALDRANHYADAGASGLFIPFVTDLSIITAVCEGSPLPVNVMRPLDGPSVQAFADAGVARISHGPFPWLAAMGAYEELVRTTLGT